MFEFQGPVTGKNMVQFKCLLGCIPPKTISSATNSRGNLKGHVKVLFIRYNLQSFSNKNFKSESYFSKSTGVGLMSSFKNVKT